MALKEAKAVAGFVKKMMTGKERAHPTQPEDPEMKEFKKETKKLEKRKK